MNSQISEIWRLIPLEIGDSVEHMSMTECLVQGASGRRPTVWWHATETPTLLVGRGVGLKQGEQFSRVRIVPRPTGGGAVLVGPGVLGVDIAMPAEHNLLSGDIVRDYRWLGEVWARALSALGVDAVPLQIEDSRREASSARTNDDLKLVCFGSASPFEVTVGGRKIVGLSQVRRRSGVLFSAAVHVDTDPADIAEVLPLPRSRARILRDDLRKRATSLQSEVGKAISVDTVMDAFRVSLYEGLGVRLRASAWGKRELRIAAAH